MIRLYAVGGLIAALGLASFGLYKQVQANGELSAQLKQKSAAIESHAVAWKFTDGVMSSQNEIVKNAETKIDNHAVANDAAERLRQQLDDYIRQSADDSAGFAEYRKATEAKLGMLADLHRESDRRAGIYADQADKNRIAGEACEQSYDSLASWIRNTYGVSQPHITDK